MSKKSVSNTSVKHGKFSIMPLGVRGEGLFIPSMFEGGRVIERRAYLV